jgi:hypothetical protein
MAGCLPTVEHLAGALEGEVLRDAFKTLWFSADSDG